jgi:hypothetical protein
MRLGFANDIHLSAILAWQSFFSLGFMQDAWIHNSNLRLGRRHDVSASTLRHQYLVVDRIRGVVGEFCCDHLHLLAADSLIDSATAERSNGAMELRWDCGHKPPSELHCCEMLMALVWILRNIVDITSHRWHSRDLLLTSSRRSQP